MAVFEVTAPDGRTYEVNAPADAKPEELRAYVQKNMMGVNTGEPPRPNYGQAGATTSGQTYAFENAERPGAIERTARAALQGATLGFGDEIVAGAAATLDRGSGGTWGDRYDAYVGRERGRMKSGREDAPVSTTGAEIAGALPTAMIPFASGPRTPGLLQGALKGGAIGGGAGAAYGFGAGDGGFGNRMNNMPVNAALGAGGGLVAPYVGLGVNRLTERLLKGETFGAAGRAGVSRPAYDILETTLGADGSLSPAGIARLNAAGPGAMMADASPQAQGLLDTIIQQGTPASAAARQAIEARATRAGGQVDAALDSAFGAPQGLRATARGISKDSAPARDAAYKAAYGQPINYASPEGMAVEAALKRVPARVMKAAIDEANESMQAQGVRNMQIMARIGDDGTVTFVEMPNVQQLDEIKRALGTLGREGVDQFGRPTAQGFRANTLANDLRDATGNAVPGYREAVDLGGDKIALDNALDLGRRMLSPQVTREMVGDATARMTPAEKAMIGRGVRAQFDEALANVQAALTDNNLDAKEAWKAVKTLSSRASREKVTAVLGEQQADAFFKQMDEASFALSLRAGVAQNSKTLPRQIMTDRLRSMTDDGAINALRSGQVGLSPESFVPRIIQGMADRTPKAKERIYNEVQTELVDILTGPNGRKVIEEMTRTGGKPSEAAMRVGRLTQMLLERNAAVSSPVVETNRAYR
jgi:hypothetical protein